jgi:mono/diheme cytochrome c family protein
MITVAGRMHWKLPVLGVVLIATVAVAAPPHARLARAYDVQCASCHGPRGMGDGVAAPALSPAPRDFTSADYKLRSTPPGEVPTEADLERTIRRGIPGTAMPSFEGRLQAAEIRALVEVLKGYSPRFDVDGPSPPEPLPAAPPPTPALVAAGRELFARAGCTSCHGVDGRGRGPRSAHLTDDRGRRLAPRDLSLPGLLKGGSTVEDVYRTLATGMDGTPMTGVSRVLPEQDIWKLAYYVLSLSQQPVPRALPRGVERASRR